MKIIKNKKKYARVRRHNKIRTRVVGSASVPRLCVFRSSKHIYAQLIDDANGVTLASSSDAKIKKGTKTEKAKEVGVLLAKEAKVKKITSAVFDRGGFIFTGRVKSLAEGAQEGGINFELV